MLVIEHDEETIMAADYVVELGTGRLVEEVELALVGASAGETKQVGYEFADEATAAVEITVREIKEKILWVVKEIQDCAKREQVEMLKKYLDYWNPFKFVTKNDVDAIVRDVIDQMRRGK